MVAAVEVRQGDDNPPALQVLASLGRHRAARRHHHRLLRPVHRVLRRRQRRSVPDTELGHWVTGSTGSLGRWVTKCDPVPCMVCILHAHGVP